MLNSISSRAFNHTLRVTWLNLVCESRLYAILPAAASDDQLKIDLDRITGGISDLRAFKTWEG